jgi:RNA polymerase sigma factor (TIGR02999 family)
VTGATLPTGGPDIEALLAALHRGEPGAQDALFAATYPELRRLARARLRDGGRNTVLDTTALVHESYLRVAGGAALRAEGRRAFFAFASQVMRSVIVDEVRARQAERRGGDLELVTLSTHLQDALPAGADGEVEVLRVHEALATMEQAEPRLAKVVEMRWFAGCTEAEVADALGVAERTVRRDWDKARRLLLVLLQG